jgi:hypothetical protein
MQSLLVHLQRTVGNQTVNNLLQRQGLLPLVQPHAAPLVLQRAPNSAVPDPDMTDESLGPTTVTQHVVKDELAAAAIKKQALKDFVTTDRDMFANL